MSREWYNKPINYYNNDQTKPYTVVVGVTTGNYNNGNPDTYVKTWMEYYKIPHTDADKLANQSRVDVKLYSQVIDGGSASGMSIWTSAENFGYAGWDNANRSSYSCTFDFNDKKLNKFFDGILTIPHLADGTKTITLQAGFSTNNHTTAITGGSVSGSVTLDAIETFKPTTIYSVSGCYYGYPTAISLDRKASNLRELVTITNGSKTFTIKGTSGAGSDATTINWTMPYEDGGVVLVPNTAYPSQSTWTLSVTTYNGSAQVGSPVTQTLTFSIRGDDTSFAPTLTAQPVVEAVNTGSNSFLGTDTAVYNISGINVKAPKADVSLKHGATIQERYVVVGGNLISADQTDHITYNLYNGSVDWRYFVRDSRGFTLSVTGTFPVYTYSRPSLDSVSVFRGDENGNPSARGTYIYATATPNIDSLNNKNELVSFTGKVGSGSAQNMTSGVLATLMSNASTALSYTVTLAVTDKIGTTTLSFGLLSVDTPPPLAVRKNGHGVGIGYSTVNEGLQVGYESTFHDDIYVEDDGDASARAWIRPDFFACGKNYTSGSITYKNSAQVFTGSLTSLVGTKVTSEQYNANDVMTNKYEAECHADHISVVHRDGYDEIKRNARLANDALVIAHADKGANTESNTRITFQEWKLDGRQFATSNLLDQSLIEQGGFNGSTGEQEPNNQKAICCTQYIKVSPNTKYSCSWSGALQPVPFFYNSSKGFISYQATSGDVGSITFTTPNNCYFVRISWDKVGTPDITPSIISNVNLEKGSSIIGYRPYTMDAPEVASKLRGVKDTTGRTVITCNLLDSALIEQGDWDGSNPTIRCHIKVKVKASTTYTQSVSGCVIAGVVYLNSSGSLISFENSGATTFTFTTPSGCAYAVPVFKKSDDSAISVSDISNCQLEKGSQASSFVPFTMDGVEVAERCREWKQIGRWYNAGDSVTLPDYATELRIVPIVVNAYVFSSLNYIIDSLTSATGHNQACTYETPTNYFICYFTKIGRTIKMESITIGSGWGNAVYLDIYVK